MTKLAAAAAAPFVGFSEPAAPPPVAVSGADASAPSASLYRVQAVAIQLAMSIPAMRRAHHQICGLPAGWPLYATQGTARLASTDPRSSWLRQPDPTRTRSWLISKTLDDAMWHDRSVWSFERNIATQPVKFARVHPDRYSTIDEPGDPDTVAAWIVDGVMLSPAEFRNRFIAFEWGGIGGLRRYGSALLSLYADLQAAAGNYARAPHPKAILKNAGPDLDDDEIDELLEDWEAARATRSVGYLNKSMDYQSHGWNAKDLQLVEAREHAALEVARLTGLPAAAVDAATGSMTYGNVVEYRKDLREALRPWTNPIVDTLSMDDRTAGVPRGLILPYGISAGFDDDAYLRDDPKTRMETWEIGLRTGVVDLADAQAQEPLSRS